MIVAVIAVWMVQAPGNQVVDVIAVRHRLVPAAGRVGVTRDAVGRSRVIVGMPRVDRDHVLIDVIAVGVVKVAVVEIVDVIVVANRDVTTPFSVDVRVIALMNRM